MLKFIVFVSLLPKIASTLNTTAGNYTVTEIIDATTYHSGECIKGTIYQIRTTKDLKTLYKDQLECIYYAALPLSKIPEGRLPLTLNGVLNNHLAAILFKDVVLAKMIFKVSCKKDDASVTFYMGLNITPVGLAYPFVATLMDNTVPVIPGEHTEKLQFLSLDYAADFRKLCDDRNPLNDIPNLHIPQGNVFPINHIVDTLRLAGRDEDGAAIVVGKGYFKLGFSKEIYSTALQFAVTSLDPQLNPEFAKGDALPPLKQGFSYRIPSVP